MTACPQPRFRKRAPWLRAPGGGCGKLPAAAACALGLGRLEQLQWPDSPKPDWWGEVPQGQRSRALRSPELWARGLRSRCCWKKQLGYALSLGCSSIGSDTQTSAFARCSHTSLWSNRSSVREAQEMSGSIGRCHLRLAERSRDGVLGMLFGLRQTGCLAAPKISKDSYEPF